MEEATRSMESSGVLNAGCGSYLTEDGTVECDAMIMDGSTLRTGKSILYKTSEIFEILQWHNVTLI